MHTVVTKMTANDIFFFYYGNFWEGFQQGLTLSLFCFVCICMKNLLIDNNKDFNTLEDEIGQQRLTMEEANHNTRCIFSLAFIVALQGYKI